MSIDLWSKIQRGAVLDLSEPSSYGLAIFLSDHPSVISLSSFSWDLETALFSFYSKAFRYSSLLSAARTHLPGLDGPLLSAFS